MSTQNEHLTERLKEAEKMIEIQKEMENKIISEYRSNIDKIKGELREKTKGTEEMMESIEHYKRKIRSMEQSQNKNRIVGEE